MEVDKPATPHIAIYIYMHSAPLARFRGLSGTLNELQILQQHLREPSHLNADR